MSLNFHNIIIDDNTGFNLLSFHPNYAGSFSLYGKCISCHKPTPRKTYMQHRYAVDVWCEYLEIMEKEGWTSADGSIVCKTCQQQ